MEKAREVLKRYGIEADTLELLRHNENMTYRVSAAGKEYVLRIHQSVATMNLSLIRGESTAEELIEGEMCLLAYLAKEKELGTQIPVQNKNGSYVTKVDDACATLLTWAEGVPLEKGAITVKEAEQIGEAVGKLHNHLNSYKTSKRYAYDEKMAKRMLQTLGDAEEEKAFSKEQADIIRETVTELQNFLQEEKDDMISVHNDLGESNLLYQGDRFVPIDFSMSGICVREMDLASLYCHFEAKELREAILKGYRKHAQIDVDEKKIDKCIGLQLLIFLLSQYKHIYQAPWFGDMVNYWCYEIFQTIQKGEPLEGQIGLFS